MDSTIQGNNKVNKGCFLGKGKHHNCNPTECTCVPERGRCWSWSLCAVAGGILCSPRAKCTGRYIYSDDSPTKTQLTQRKLCGRTCLANDNLFQVRVFLILFHFSQYHQCYKTTCTLRGEMTQKISTHQEKQPGIVSKGKHNTCNTTEAQVFL